jgi:hypothetical protein
MTGHKTESVYRRYDIVSERDLQEAAERLDRLAGTISGTNEGGRVIPLKGVSRKCWRKRMGVEPIADWLTAGHRI